MSERLHFVFDNLQSQGVMSAVVGGQPEMTPATLLDHDLFLHPMGAPLDPTVERILAVHRTPEEMRRFAAFAVRPMVGRVVEGKVAAISKAQRALLDNWNVEGLWHDRVDDARVLVHGEERTAAVHVMQSRRLVVARSVFGTMIPVHLNEPPDRVAEIATKVRQAFFAGATSS